MPKKRHLQHDPDLPHIFSHLLLGAIDWDDVFLSVLLSADGACLLTDAAEGPIGQDMATSPQGGERISGAGKGCDRAHVGGGRKGAISNRRSRG